MFLFTSLSVLIINDPNTFFFLPTGPLHTGELQVPPPAGPPQDPAGDQWAEQPDPTEDGRRYACAADAVYDPRHHHAARGQCRIPSGNLILTSWGKLLKERLNEAFIQCLKVLLQVVHRISL